MALFENEYVSISIDESVPCLVWIGKQFIPSDVFRESEEKSLELYRQYKSEYPQLEWFVDASNIGPLAAEDTQWVVDEILPQFAAAGLNKEAFVVPQSAMGKMVVKDYISKSGQTIQMNMFDDTKAAKDWLRE